MDFDLKNASVASLAYLGDSVMELLVRTHLVRSGITSSRALNERALDFVRAGAQSRAASNILDYLTEEETAYFRRGRNIGHTGVPKSATVAEYRQATGLEVLFAYLYLEGKEERIRELFALAYADMMENNK